MTEQSQHRRPIIGYITPQIYSSYFRLLLAGVQRAARERGAGLMVFQMSAQEVAESQVGRDRVSGWVACFSDRHTAGLEDLARSGRPLVTTSVPVAGAPVVVTDNTSGMRSVVEHLLDLGHRRVGFVGWVGNPDIPYRLAGYRQALEARGIPFDPALVTTLTGGWQHDGAAFAEQLVAAGRSCTALAFANDNLALGAMRVFQSAGVRIPQDLAITGFDDMPEAQIATPPLTTVRMRFSAMSRAATEHLLDIAAGAPPAAEPIMIPMSLVVRRSAGEPSHRPTEVPADIAKRGLLARRLAEMVGAPEVLAPGEPPSRLWPGVDTVVEMVDAALRADAGPDDSAIQQAWSSAVAASSYADPLEGAVGQIEAVLRAELASQPPESPAHQSVADAIQRLRVMLLRACVGGQIERINRSEQALSFSDSAARSLADSDLATACGLGWLEHSGVSAAALGLWDAQGQPRHLRIAGR